MLLGLVDHQKKTKIAFSNWNPLGNDLLCVARPFISRNSSCPRSRLLCTQKKHIWTTDSTKQSKKRSEFIGLRNRPKTAKYVHFMNMAKIWHLFGDFSVRWTQIFFWIASLKPWFKCASFEYKEAYFSDNLNFDL